MIQIVKKIIPTQLIPLIQKIYWKYFEKSDFSKQKINSTAVLICTVTYNKFGAYCVPKSSQHRTAAQKLLYNHVHEPKTIEFIRANCGSGDIVHAGTYFGDFLPALSQACSPTSKVWAFEPNLENFKCANITIQLNEIKNVVLTNAGLGAKNEHVYLRTIDDKGKALGGGSQIVDSILSDKNDADLIKIVTIDDAVGMDRMVSIIHLDVEGYEKEALCGALKIINICLPILILEILPNSTLLDSEWFSENILKLGYHMVDTIEGNSIFTCKSKM